MKCNSDHIGTVISCACLIHCTALPLVLVGVGLTANDTLIHGLFFIGALGITGHATYHSYKKHCKHIVIFFASIGILLLGIDLISSIVGVHDHYVIHEHGDHSHIDFSKTSDEVHYEILTIIGSCFLIATHLFNFIYNKSTTTCCNKNY